MADITTLDDHQCNFQGWSHWVTEYTYFQTKEHQSTGSALVDVREPGELKAHGIVPGAIDIPIGYVDEAFAMDNESFKAIIGAEKPDIDEPVIFFCVKGIRAQSASDLVNDKFKYKQSLFYPGPFTHLQ